MAYNGVLDRDGFKAKLTGKLEVSVTLYKVKFRATPGDLVNIFNFTL